MKKRKVISLSVFLSFFAVLANANTLANNPTVAKALKHMQQQLVKKNLNNKNKTITPKQELTDKNKHQEKATGLKDVSLQGSTVIVRLYPKTQYKTRYYKGIKTFVVDIIAPNLKTAVLKKTIKGNNIIKKIVIAKHSSKTDICLYQKPFIRISIILLKDSSYTISKTDNKIKISFQSAEIKKVEKKSLKKIAKNYYISLKNISCIVSPYPVQKVLFSKESGMQVQVVNQRYVFIKPIPVSSFSIGKPTYSKQQKGVYIVTPAKVYSLNLIPKENMPSVTYYLQGEKTIKKEKSKNNAYSVNATVNSFFTKKNTQVLQTASDFEKTLLTLIKDAYNHMLPSGFILQPLKDTHEYVQLSLNGKYKLVSSLYTVYVYEIYAKQNLNLDSAQFIYLFDNLLAITVVKPRLYKNETTFLIAVTQGVEK